VVVVAVVELSRLPGGLPNSSAAGVGSSSWPSGLDLDGSGVGDDAAKFSY
jgi:hypothetical protein